MKFAIVGTGYVADLYVASLPNHPGLELAGAYDRSSGRLDAFCRHWNTQAYASYDELLNDQEVGLIVNLTNPASHFPLTLQALEAGKHVYSEKPLSLQFEQGLTLVQAAERNRVLLACAPCTVLGESAQTLWRELRRGRIGTPRLVYAELSDGPVPLMEPDRWKNESGAPWPVKDEFEVGCTLEHAGYYVTWLTAFFGPVRRVSVFGTTVLPDKGVAVDVHTPDLTVSLLEFHSGVVARITCDIFASHDHRLRVFGDAGVLGLEDCWDMGSNVAFSSRSPLELRNGLVSERYPSKRWAPWLRPQKVPLVRKPDFIFGGGAGAHRIDFLRGAAELASAAEQGRSSRLSARWSLHVLEVVLAMSVEGPGVRCCEMETTFDALEPMPWAN